VTAGTAAIPARAVDDDLAGVARELEPAGAEAILTWAFDRFERVALVSSFQAESIVLIDLASRLRPGVEVVTLDTGRLPEATHELMDTVRSRFPIRLRVIAPEPAGIEAMVAAHGINLFYRSPEQRHLCCEVRKTRPLTEVLRGYEAWVTGLRREQATTRRTTPVVARDPVHGGITKLAPLASWTHDDVWNHVRAHDLPHHALYDAGYTSIGCAPCTRAPGPGEDERAGRWWWEGDGIKECGLHAAWPGAPVPPAAG
jgi:thioredoxin-dependent adenylylsulfate APS reductase